MKKIVSLVVLFLAALFTCGCEKLSEDKHQDFVMMTPDVGNLTFKKLTAQTVDSQYILTARTDVSGDVIDHTWVVMHLSFNKDASIGKVLTLNGISFGPYNTENIYATSLSSGRIYLKNKTDRNVILRFKDVRFTMDWGVYILNGDLTFSIEYFL